MDTLKAIENEKKQMVKDMLQMDINERRNFQEYEQRVKKHDINDANRLLAENARTNQERDRGINNKYAQFQDR